MKHPKNVMVLAGLLLVSSWAMASQGVQVGQSAPDFTGHDSVGQAHRLSDYRGKFVVLEWHNQGCPFTKKHYESGNMQRLQKEWRAKGVIWLTVISSAPGKQGFVTPAQENDYLAKMNAVPTAALLDPAGVIGQLYGAKTTPQMVVINPEGVVVYDGAIDDHSTTDAADIPASKNYVDAALKEATAGKPVSEASTRPYGCSVKYAD
jgi:peroxiredoxin